MAFWVIYMQIYEVILILFHNGMLGNFLYRFRGLFYFIFNNGMVGNFI